ncbi:MAG: molecular chaperone DnaK [Candidatus Sumerlaeia bacterium]
MTKKSTARVKSEPAAKTTQPARSASSSPVQLDTPVQNQPEKKKKRKCPLTPKQLEKMRQILLNEKERLKAEIERLEELANSSKSGNADAHPGYSTHIAEFASDSQFIETSYVQLTYLQRQLNEVREALERIEDGTYGICQGSGAPIPFKRLLAKPTARYSIEYRKKYESGQL